MFEKEANGLKLLQAINTFTIPEVIAVGETEKETFLILEWIESTSPETNFWQHFGKQLAQLYQNTHAMFGLDHDNYMGSLHQNNHQHANWIDFFVIERLQPQIKLAMNHGQMYASDLSKFENLFKRLSEIFPEESPALLHGDLWSGNYMVGNHGEPVIMDPAVYYGHREMDIAMTRLFGGFNPKMYETYQAHYPLEKGWEDRIDICNLYPLLIHVNLFGGSYARQVQQIIRLF